MKPIDDPVYREIMLRSVSDTLHDLELLIKQVYRKAGSYPPAGDLEAGGTDNGQRGEP